MIDSVQANVAVSGANVAQVDAKSAADGAVICADGGKGAVSVFQGIFEKLNQAVAGQAAGEVQTTDALKLPELCDVPPVANGELTEELPVGELPALVGFDLNQDAVVAEELPVKEPAELVGIEPVEDGVDAEKLPAQAPTPQAATASLVILETEPESGEPVEEPKPEHEEKAEKRVEAKCDEAILPAPTPAQMVMTEARPEVAAEEVEDSPPAVAESNGNRRPAQAGTLNLPKAKETDEEVSLKQIPPQKAETETEPVEVVGQSLEEMPVAVKEEATTAERHKAEPQKVEFSLPQPHVAQKEIDRPEMSPPVAAEQAFVEANHPKIAMAIHGELLPDGGSVHIRMDPPELGALAVQIVVRDGIVTASFQTSNDEATRLLSHSLGQLRTTLESAGVSVEKLQVQQAPREHFNSNSRDAERGPGQQAYERSAHDDQQRREMLQRMWRRLAVGRDMLDLVA
ncbi:MAG TPA: flagellar hook-length control protein FliK [Tepidisphaeraceae bacterium]|jgi:flagellar hook-length control protein FliK|nr:flagellar hook-length control protein FliK [Tepidisphaeraceae bacterium]